MSQMDGSDGQGTESLEFDLDFTGDAGETTGQNLNPTDPQPEGGATPDPQPEGQPAPSTAPATPPTGGEPQPEPSPEDDAESLRKQLAEANLRLLQYQQAEAKQGQPQAPTASGTTQVTPPTPSPFPQMPNEVSNLDFIGQEDHIKLLETKEGFNGLLNKVATVAYNAAVMAAQERILRQIPEVVETTANQQMQIKDIVGRFYTANKDLEPYKPAVSMAAIKLHNEHADMPLEELLNKAAEETRKVLRIRPGTQARQRVPAQPAGSGRVGGDRASQPTGLSEQEQQILDLLS